MKLLFNDVNKQGVDMSWTLILIVQLSNKEKQSLLMGHSKPLFFSFLSILDSNVFGITSATDFGSTLRPIWHLLRMYETYAKNPHSM